jgi:hypothetical protein
MVLDLNVLIETSLPDRREADGLAMPAQHLSRRHSDAQRGAGRCVPPRGVDQENGMRSPASDHRDHRSEPLANSYVSAADAATQKRPPLI